MEQIQARSDKVYFPKSESESQPLQLARADIDFGDFKKITASTLPGTKNDAPEPGIDSPTNKSVIAEGSDGFRLEKTLKLEEPERQPRDFDPESLAAMHRSIKSPEQLQEIKKEFKTHSKDAKEELLKAFGDPNIRVVGLGEFHTDSSDTPHYAFLKNMVNDMKKAGITHLTWEEKSPEFLKRLLREPTAETWRDSDGRLIGPGIIDFIKAAHKAGIKVSTVDTEGNHGERDRHAESKISEILKADPKNKVLHLGGMNHLRQHSGPEQEKSLAQLLTEKGNTEGFKTYFAAMLTSGADLNKRTAPSYLGNYLNKPTIVDIEASQKLKDLHINTDKIGYPARDHAKLGKFGKVLLLPQYLSYPGKAAPRPEGPQSGSTVTEEKL